MYPTFPRFPFFPSAFPLPVHPILLLQHVQVRADRAEHLAKRMLYLNSEGFNDGVVLPAGTKAQPNPLPPPPSPYSRLSTVGVPEEGVERKAASLEENGFGHPVSSTPPTVRI